MCGLYTVSYGLTRSLADSHGLSRSCTIANTIIHGHGTRVSFFKVLKITHGFHGYTRMAECNSDKATVGSVVCTVYTDGQPYEPCVLCQTGFSFFYREILIGSYIFDLSANPSTSHYYFEVNHCTTDCFLAIMLGILTLL